MNHIIFADKEQYKTALLIKESYLDKDKIQRYYLNKVDLDDVIIFGLPYLTKMTVSKAKHQLNKLLPVLVKLGITSLYVADATYFKALTKAKKTDTEVGYVVSCTIKDFEHINVILGINYGQLLYNPNLMPKLDLTVDTWIKHLKGQTNQLGDDVIHHAVYDSSQLNKLLNYDKLTIDIETTGLKVGSTILSIAFATDQHNGMAFEVKDTKMLKTFFERYKGMKIFHNATFDVKHIIYNCFMKHANDIDGLLYGLHTMCRNLHDTKIIAYLATNNTQGNTLKLKQLSHEYTGNYGLNVSNLTEVTDEVLEYNLKDALATFYVYNKYRPIMLKDNQLSIYNDIMMPSIKTVIQMELTGMPIDTQRVNQVHKQLSEVVQQHLDTISTHPAVLACEHELKLLKLESINSKLKTKQYGMEKVDDYLFNPNSNTHLQYLLYTTLGLDVIDYTDNKQPATGSSTLKKLINHTDDESIKNLLNALIGFNKANKIISTFIPALQSSIKRDDWHYLHGNFNMGGTLSGRMSSNNPNLQNIPSGSTYGKLIKSCFKAPKGWIMCGADFNALEDRINTVLTKDPNKEKVWVDGYDAHCFRAYYYFKDQMPDIEYNVESINSIKNRYPQLRQDSKAPSFALQYGGQYFTLMNNCGFDEKTAKSIEANYHKMYQVSDDWVADKIALAEKQGYIISAFGLKIRTPIVGRTVLGTSKTPYKATAEARSLANAVSGQSYGLLTNRATNAFMERVWDSEYRNDILPIAMIHDAVYFIVRDDVRVIEWVNRYLIKEMQWQELDEIKHPQVHLEAELDLYPTWDKPITLANNINQKQIKETVKLSISSG